MEKEKEKVRKELEGLHQHVGYLLQLLRIVSELNPVESEILISGVDSYVLSSVDNILNLKKKHYAN